MKFVYIPLIMMLMSTVSTVSYEPHGVNHAGIEEIAYPEQELRALKDNNINIKIRRGDRMVVRKVWFY